MNAAVLLVLTALGDYGYEPLKDGGFCYIVQLTPAEAQEVAGGQNEAYSDIPSKLKDVRTFRVQIGSSKPPRTGSPPTYEPNAPATVAATTDPTLAGWEPAPEGGYEYTIQLSPDETKQFLKGEPVFRDLPNWLHDLRRCTVIVGEERLPQKKRPEDQAGTPKKETKPSTPATRPSISPPAPSSFDSAFDKEPAPKSNRGFPKESDAGPSLSVDDQLGTGRAGRLGRGTSSTSTDPFDRPRAKSGFTDREDSTGFPPDDRDSARNDRTASRTRSRPADDGFGSLDDRDSRSGLEAPGQRGGGFASDDDGWPSSRGAERRGRPTSGDSQARYEEDTGRSSGRLGSNDDLPEEDSPSVRRDRESARRASEEKPWVPFTLAMLGLFASLGGNAFLGFLYWELREKAERKLRLPLGSDSERWSGPRLNDGASSRSDVA